MGAVVSLGSIDVDRIHRVSDGEIADLSDRYEIPIECGLYGSW